MYLKKARKQPLLYFRLLDDIFIIWTHSEKDFWEFFEVLNTHSESIKLKAEIHLQEIHFLDATLFKGKRFQSKGLIDLLTNSHTNKNRVSHNALQSNESHLIRIGQQHINITSITMN